jgi:cytidylate kinase
MLRSDHALFLITGPMASGKSTVARLLAQRFERGVDVEGDVFRRNVAAGRHEMAPDPSREASREQTGYKRWSVEELNRGFASETPRIGLWVDTCNRRPSRR